MNECASVSESHEQFEHLSALEASGEISIDERKKLHDHLQICGDCRQVLSEYNAWIEALSERSEIHARTPAPKGMYGRFRGRALNHGIQLPQDQELIQERRHPRAWLAPNTWMAMTPRKAAIVLVFVVIAVTIPFAVHRIRQGHEGTVQRASAIQKSTSERAGEDKSPTSQPKQDEVTDAAHSARLQKEIATLEAQLSHERRRTVEVDEVRTFLRDPNARVTQLWGVKQSKGLRPFALALYIPREKLLLFAYDFTDQHTRRTHSLYAWGITGTNKQVEALGKLSVESKNDDRWILRIGTHDVLSRIDQVYITIESNHTNPLEPTGPPVLIMSLNTTNR